jgi:hypothetical protein
MALDVEIRIIKENHHHRGMLCHPGDLITVEPGRAQRLIAQGLGEKVGVKEREGEATEEVAEVLSEDDVEDIVDEDDEVGEAD